MPYCSAERITAYDSSTVGRVLEHLPDGPVRNIVIKPNWVKHAATPDFPIGAMVTDSRLIDAIIEACKTKYPEAEEILIGDAPLQGCDWRLLVEQAGINELVEKHRRTTGPRVLFEDLRANRVHVSEGYIQNRETELSGDPRGYRDVVLDQSSFLDEISSSGKRFRVADYEPKETISNHRQGYHRYTIAGSILNADLLINVPKMKCHQKAGVTGALKNVVGINGNKANLVHYRHGFSHVLGDEFPPNAPLAVVAQVRVRKLVAGAPRWVFRPLQLAWRTYRRTFGIQVRGTRPNLGKRFFISGGSWHGNDTIWRMIYDLNRIVLHGSADGGALQPHPQRKYVAILDGLVGGEGNGPLQALPVETGLLVFADDPFLMDMAMASFMGFDWRKVPTLSNFRRFEGDLWAKYEPAHVRVLLDGREYHGVDSLPVVRQYVPPPGWRGHIERDA